jgi:hypothetical protein
VSDKVIHDLHPERVILTPEYSEWRCELFGTGPMGITMRPLKGQEPNRFWRWVQRLCFGNKWIKGTGK